MSPWAGYRNRFVERMMQLDISVVEKALMLTVLFTLVVSAYDTMQGRNVGDPDVIRLAKLKAQQEWMAQRTDTRN